MAPTALESQVDGQQRGGRGLGDAGHPGIQLLRPRPHLQGLRAGKFKKKIFFIKKFFFNFLIKIFCDSLETKCPISLCET